MLQSQSKRFGLVASVALTPIVLVAAVLIAMSGGVMASSHREAPLISKDAFADNTDTYMFLSPKDQKNLVLIGSWIPMEGPEGAPNYWEWDDSALYDIYIDNDGDASPDITYTLSSRSEVGNQLTFLYNTFPINNLTDTSWNHRQYVTITESTEAGVVKTLVANKLTTPSNIGEKSTPNYATLEAQAIQTVTEGPDTIKIYAGQTDDAFWVDLQVFDLLTLRGQDGTGKLPGALLPLGYTQNNIAIDSVSGFNVHSLVIEVPVSRLKQGGSEPVVGMWSGTRRSSTRVIQALNTISSSVETVQVSRLGLPLVNELVLPLALKDAFNSLKPRQDLDLYTYAGADPFLQTVQTVLQKSVEDPEIGNLLCTVYGKTNIPMPADANKDCKTEVTNGTPRSGRGDIFDIFLTGMKLAKPFTITTAGGPVALPAGTNVNQPAGVRPAEMIRINTNISGTLCSPTPSRLGVLGGDACGFPNGRRLGDDIVEIELLAVAGAAYQVLDGRDTTFSFNPGLIDVLDDGIDRNDIPFRKEFPYMAMAQSGQAHWHTNAYFNILLPWIQKTMDGVKQSMPSWLEL